MRVERARERGGDIHRHAKREGRRPAAEGRRYTFFAIPREGEWTLIFNRVPRQWGASDYNPAFDALRVAVKPSEAMHQEDLRYTIEPAGANGAVVTLAWEKRTVRFRIGVSP
jgi:hypothetical protein